MNENSISIVSKEIITGVAVAIIPVSYLHYRKHTKLLELKFRI
jgi:hypothetical protein